ncbi:hypothetical protein M9Y10_010931 [Tritrichomonas musculus]|uniref:DUF3447 domain-containing protein n=1 Tax=Tritrichomonas musculus TaxID=1915356 RepID=A0ABR2IM20_9EUKA
MIKSNNNQNILIYMNKERLSFDSFIRESIFETNPFLLEDNKIRIIEYASFFGCMEIIKFIINIEKIEPISSMWNFSIHSENSELIHYLEDNKILPEDMKHETTLKESIK